LQARAGPKSVRTARGHISGVMAAFRPEIALSGPVTEGFDTADLKEAKSLLNQLS